MGCPRGHHFFNFTAHLTNLSMKFNFTHAVFALCLLFSSPVVAQYCGNSSSSICTPQSGITQLGFYPPADSLPCSVVGQPYSQVINFHTPDSVTSGGSTYKLNYVKIDTISNLPCGLCWASNISNNQINGNTTACIQVSGTTYDQPGQYLLHIIVDANIKTIFGNFTVANQNASALGVKYYGKVQLPGGTCIHIDTSAPSKTAATSGSIITPVISGNTSFCPGGSTTLTFPGHNYYAYQWSNGATDSTITVSAAGTYTVTAYAHCTSATASKTISVYTVTRPTITPSGSAIVCQGSSINLSSSSASAYHWSTNATTQNISVSSAGNYSVTITDAHSCTAVSDTTAVTVGALPDNTVNAGGPTTFCAGGSVTLTAVAGLTYNWGSSTNQSINVTSTGNYSVTVTGSNNCTAASTPISVTVNPAPDNSVSANGPTTFCSGGSVTLTAAAGLSYNWGSSTNRSITISTAGTYTVTVTNGNNCTAVSTPVTVTVNTLPDATVTANGPTTFCAGGSVTLSAVAGLTYHWSDNSSNQTLVASTGGSYKVTVTNGNNCSAVSTVTVVTVNAAPDNSVTTSGPTTFCAGGSVTLTAAAGLSYSWSNSTSNQSIIVSSANTYKVTVTNGNNCTAVSTPITVTVNAAPDNSVNVGGATTFCPGDSVQLTAASGLNYHWSNNATTQSIFASAVGTYKVTVTNGNNCTAVSSGITISNNAVTNINNQLVDQSTCINGNVTFSISATGTNLSYIWLHNGNVTGNTGSSYNIPSAALTDTGTYQVIVTGDCGADTSNIATLIVGTTLTFSLQPVSHSACEGSSTSFSVVANGANATYQWFKDGVAINNAQQSTYTIASVDVSDAGSYKCFVTSDCGDDTSDVAQLTVLQPTSFAFSQTICASGSFNFNGQILTTAGTYIDTIPASNGCDSVITLTLSVTQSLSTVLTDTICAGSSVIFAGQTLTTSGAYNDTLQSSTNCDSIVTLNLTVLAPVVSNISAGFCTGSTYNFNGQVLSTAGTYNDTLTAASGCDSIVVLTLSEILPSTTTIDTSICAGSSVLFNGQTLTSTGTYFATLTGSNTCDSIVTLNLTVLQPSYDTIEASICQSSSYPFNGQNLTSAGTYTETLVAANGCDSLLTLVLTVLQPTGSTIDAAICQGDGYQFNGQTLTTQGTYTQTLTGSNTCDSVITLHLTVNPIVNTVINAGVCTGGSYLFNGQVLTASGTYYDTLTNVNNCDSIVTLNLQVDSIISINISGEICEGSTYNFNGQQLSFAGLYTDTLSAQGGCDSVVTLDLLVHPISHDTIYVTQCDSGYMFSGQLLTTSGEYHLSTSGIYGCDSLVTLYLTINHSSTTNITAAICTGSSYDFNGQTLTAGGNYTYSTTNSSGCDSTVYLTLTVDNTLYTQLSANICAGHSYSFAGQILTAAGTYNDTLSAQGGCDSVITLSLNVISPTVTPISASICAGAAYSFNGQQLTSSGVYSDTLTGSNTCDSIVVLTLTVNQPTGSSVSHSICAGDSYVFGGNTLTTAGTYRDTLQGSNTCDSIVTLTLTVNQPVTTVIADSICQGDSYNFNGTTLTSGGIYHDTLSAANTCDSIVTLHLTVLAPPTVNWAGGPDTICSNAASFSITGATPVGGTYSGTGVTNNVFNAASAGTGSHVITYNYSNLLCSGSATKTFVVKVCLGIDELNLADMVTLYPNPVNDVLTLKSDLFTEHTALPAVYDIAGKILSVPYTLMADKVILNTSKLAVGSYIIRLSLAEKTVNLKFIKVD